MAANTPSKPINPSLVLFNLNRDPDQVFGDEEHLRQTLGKAVLCHAGGEDLRKSHIQAFIKLQIALTASEVLLQLDQMPQSLALGTLQHIAPAYKHMPLVVYVPTEAPEYECPVFGETFETLQQLDLLRKLHTLFGPIVVVGHRPAGLKDPLHYLELIAPYARQLLFLEDDDTPGADALRDQLEVLAPTTVVRRAVPVAAASGFQSADDEPTEEDLLGLDDLGDDDLDNDDVGDPNWSDDDELDDDEEDAVWDDGGREDAYDSFEGDYD